MNVELMVVFLLGGLAVNSFIIAINAKGTVRIILSYILSTTVLIGALVVIIQYANEQNIRVQREREAQLTAQLAENQRLQEQRLKEEEAARLAALAEEAARLAALANAAASQDKQIMEGLLAICQKGTRQAQSLLGINIDELDDYDGMANRSSGYVGSAVALQKELDGIKKTVGASFTVSISTAEKAVQQLIAGASNFKKFFQVESEDEQEQEQVKARYVSNLKAAIYSFQQTKELMPEKK